MSRAQIARRLVKLFPAHKTYVEPFCGKAPAFLQKGPSPIEVVSDISASPIRALKTNNRVSSALRKRIDAARLLTIDFSVAVAKYDSRSTFHFFDPPHTLDLARLRKTLEEIDGKFLVVTETPFDASGFEVKRLKREGAPALLLVSNFRIERKSLGGLELDDVVGIVEVGAGGETIMPTSSDTVVAARAEKAAPGPDMVTRFTAPLSVRFHKGRGFDLALALPDGVWILNAQKAVLPEGGDVLEVSKCFAVTGSRFFHPLTEGVRAAKQEDASVNVEAAFRIDAPRVEPGVQAETFKEYFLTKGDELEGILTLERMVESEPNFDAKHPWLATFDTRLPFALTKFAALKADAPMPPEGVSALPSSLEAQVPAAFRYWTMKGEDAERAHEALKSSGILAGDHVAIVDGDFTRVETQLVEAQALAEPAQTSSGWVDACVKALLPEQLSNVKGWGAPVLMDLKKRSEGASYAAVVDELSKASAHYVVTAPASGEAIASLAKLGRVFKFRASPGGLGVEAESRVFVTSFGVQRDDIVYVDKAVLDTPAPPTRDRDKEPKKKPSLYSGQSDDKPDLGKADFNNPTPPASTDIAPGFLQPAQGNPYRKRPRYKFDRDVSIIGKAEEEQIAYGVVLEPDEVDAQADIYSAEEVRAAAHKYMADFRNRGLMHEGFINDDADVVESFIAPIDYAIGDEAVKKGTWVLAMRVRDPDLWQMVKGGQLTGFSIGGRAERIPESVAPVAKALKRTAYQGIPVTIDRPMGYTMTGKDQQGNAWTRTYLCDYGYIPRTKGGDGEGVDVFMGPNPDSSTAHWIVQLKSDGTFDEYKVVLGANSAEEAKQIYLDHVPERFFGTMFPMGIEQMKALLNREPSHDVGASPA